MSGLPLGGKMFDPTSLDATVTAARSFTRFYTGFSGALSDRMLRSPYSLAQVRVIYELANGPADMPAADMARALRMDAGQLSRILTALERDGMIRREPCDINARKLKIELTPKGREAYEGFDRLSHDEMSTALAGLTPADRTRLVRAMDQVSTLLGPRPHAAAPLVLRDLEPGDLGWVAEREAVLYAGEYGWNDDFEALVLKILADFAEARDPASERGWIAELDGQRVGAVFVVRKDTATAKLRLLHVERAARGRGVGRALVDACLAWSRDAGYSDIELWTNDILASARRIYIQAGFKLVGEETHHSFGHDLVGQVWARRL